MAGWNKPIKGIAANLDETIHSLEFATSQEAWDELNKAFLRLDPVLFEKGGTANSGLAVVYNVFIKIRKAWVDPNFDYGRMFNYTPSKWNSLLNNYIDFNRLDLMRSKIRQFMLKNTGNYNISYVFNNKHDNGKQCLLAATFSRRFGLDIPVITMVLRASEITKRLIFDFLLIQRMSEYIYGPNQTVSLNLFCTQMYGNTETLLMYDTREPLKEVCKGIHNPWVKVCKEKLKDIKTSPESKYFNFKVFFRSFKVLRPDLYKDEYKSMYAKDLKLEYEDNIPYPEECITWSQRKQFKKKYLKQLEKEK